MSTLSQQVYGELRRRLELGEFDGTPLSEPTLARELGVSRTPVREAIRRLEAERLLEQRPRQGTYVRRPDAKELDELYELRCLVEPNAAARAAEHEGGEFASELARILARMREVIDAMAADPAGAGEFERAHAALDQTFHQTVLEAAGNRTITTVVASVGMLGRAFACPKDSPLKLTPHLRRTYREHKAIADAIRAGDPAEASAAMLAHLAHGRRTAVEFARRLAEAAAPEAT